MYERAYACMSVHMSASDSHSAAILYIINLSYLIYLCFLILLFPVAFILYFVNKLYKAKQSSIINFSFYIVYSKSTSEKTIQPKKIGVRRCLGELGVSEGAKTKRGIFYFFSLSGFKSRVFLFYDMFRIVFVAEFEPSAAVGFKIFFIKPS
jgi:hypothetical protein